MTDAPPPAVLEAYGWSDAIPSAITIGLINRTYRVDAHDGRRFILQRLHPVFAPEVNLDIETITAHLAACGVTTPRLVRTRDDAPWVPTPEGPWRALTHVEGRCIGEIATPSLARAAGRMAGRVARAPADLQHRFAFGRAGVHDTEAHLGRLARAVSATDAPAPPEVISLAGEILEHARALPPPTALPSRIVHGDLKASNLLFEHDRDEPVCLVDLDTMAHGTVATEMGDALRSWTNPRGEDDARGEVDPSLFAAALEGYLDEARELLTPGERTCFPVGLETIALELASRFCLDAIEDRYFGWNARKYASRRDHNVVRTRSQLSLARSARARRVELDAIVRRLA